nr:hypothetical protein [Gemmatimonadota bacterium]
ARRLLLAGLARRLGRPAPAQGREAEFLEQLAHGLPAACEPAAALLAEWGRGPRADLVSLTHHADRLVAEARRL